MSAPVPSEDELADQRARAEEIKWSMGVHLTLDYTRPWSDEDLERAARLATEATPDWVRLSRRSRRWWPL